VLLDDDELDDIRAVVDAGAKEEKAVTTDDDDENANRANAQAEEENCMMAWLFAWFGKTATRWLR